VLLEAWRGHVARFPGDELWLCGFTAGELAAHGAWAKLPGLRVMGYVTRMDSVYHDVDVVVSASFHEGFGYTLLEGAARGCCIVSSAVPGPDVMFTPWMRPLLFAAGDSVDLARVMACLSSAITSLARGQLLSYRSARRFAMHKLSYPLIDAEPSI
jgi:glycosyltransferase involved in cell wall biosynthesis